jgi:dihydrofolate reductase
MSDSRISLIAAIGARTRALGEGNQLLWHIPDDLKRFKELTNGHPVIMGRKTWESLPEKFRPLPGRLNILVTRQQNYEAGGATVCASLKEAFDVARSETTDEIFVIGGGEIYKQALPFADRLYLTLVDDDKVGDVFFPEYETTFTKILSKESHESNGLHYSWLDLERE